MKIAYIYYAYAVKGGVERIFCDKMNWLADVAGYDIYFITYEQGRHPDVYPLSKKIHRIDLNTRFFVSHPGNIIEKICNRYYLRKTFKQRLQATLAEINPDIVVSTTSDLSLSYLIIDMPYRHVIESHLFRRELVKPLLTYNVFLNRLIMYYVNKSLKKIKKACKLVVLTHNDAKEWKGYDNVMVIPNVVNSYPNHIALLENRPKRIVSVGRLHAQKGFDLLIQSWQLIAARHPDWQLVVYGHGGDLQKLQQQLEKAGLTSSMTFAGATDNIYKEYQDSAFYVMSSRYEGWGLVLVEAMSCGLPCVSFDCPYGPSDIIRDGEDGFLVENGNIQQLAEKMELLINNKELRERLGVRARLNAARFTSDNIMPQWTKLFETIVQNDNH